LGRREDVMRKNKALNREIGEIGSFSFDFSLPEQGK
jgi:hypothetical protein